MFHGGTQPFETSQDAEGLLPITVNGSGHQMLVTGRSRTIGLILSPPDLIFADAFAPMVIFGVNEACHASAADEGSCAEEL
jgi:hypothetical protein